MIEALVNKQIASGANKLKLFALLLLIACIYLLVQSVLSSLAYLNHYHVNATLDRWYENKQQASLNEWEELELFALSSLHGNENNATMLNAVGRVYDYRSAKMEKKWKTKKLYGEKSIDYYRQVIQERPAWPYGWMNLAFSKARLRVLDDEFERALLQLLKRAPWEKTTLPSILQLSLFSWPYLDTDSRRLLLDYFIIAQEKRGGEVYRVVKSFDRLALYCSLIKGGNVHPAFCH